MRIVNSSFLWVLVAIIVAAVDGACKDYGNSVFGCDPGQLCQTYGDGDRDPNAANWASSGTCIKCPPSYFCSGGNSTTAAGATNPATMSPCPIGKFGTTGGATSEASCKKPYTRCKISTLDTRSGHYTFSYSKENKMLAAAHLNGQKDLDISIFNTSTISEARSNCNTTTLSEIASRKSTFQAGAWSVWAFHDPWLVLSEWYQSKLHFYKRSGSSFTYSETMSLGGWCGYSLAISSSGKVMGVGCIIAKTLRIYSKSSIEAKWSTASVAVVGGGTRFGNAVAVTDNYVAGGGGGDDQSKWIYRSCSYTSNAYLFAKSGYGGFEFSSNCERLLIYQILHCINFYDR